MHCPPPNKPLLHRLTLPVLNCWYQGSAKVLVEVWGFSTPPWPRFSIRSAPRSASSFISWFSSCGLHVFALRDLIIRIITCTFQTDSVRLKMKLKVEWCPCHFHLLTYPMHFITRDLYVAVCGTSPAGCHCRNAVKHAPVCIRFGRIIRPREVLCSN